MKNLIKKAIYVFLFVACSMITRAQLKLDGVYDEFICPGHQTCYIINLNYQIVDVTWTTTNGSFSPTEKVTTKRGDLNGTCVYWDNAVASNGNAPSGSVVASVTYKLSENNFRTTTTNTVTQKIRSLKGVTPPGITSSISSNALPFGTQNINIDFSSQFYFPGSKLDGSKIPVIRYEWTLPNGWQTTDGKTGTFIVGNRAIGIITNKISAGTVKVRGVSDCALDNNSNYSQITFKRTFGFTNYPSSIKFGENQSFTYKVTPVEGVEYEWSLPADWTKTSGGNTNTVTLTKSICAVSADVKVRLKVGSEYSEWYTCPNTTVLPPDITIPAIEQFRDVNVATNIPNSQIQSFSISGDGVSTVGGQGTNTLVCRFDKTGSKELTIGVTLKGCGSSYSFKKTVQVSAIKLAISGADVICPYDNPHSYSISDLPAGADVTWSSTNHLTTTNNKGSSCSFNAGKSGIGSVKADISIRGTNMNISRNIEISTVPGEPGINPYITYSTDRDYLSLNLHTPNLYGIRELIWTAQPFDSGGSSHSSHTGPGGYYWTIPTGRYTIEVRIVTQCGHLMLTTTVGGYSRAYPNPVEQTLFVEIDNPMESAPSTLSTFSRQIPEYDVRLFNIQGALVRSQKTPGGKISLDVSNLPNGNYFLHIYKDSGAVPETHKIVIRH